GEAEAVVAAPRAGRTGTLPVAYFASAGAARLPQAVRRLTTDFPGVRLDLELRENMPDDPDARADVQLVVAPRGFAPGSGFRSHHLLDDPYVVVLRDDHPLALRDTDERA